MMLTSAKCLYAQSLCEKGWSVTDISAVTGIPRAMVREAIGTDVAERAALSEARRACLRRCPRGRTWDEHYRIVDAVFGDV